MARTATAITWSVECAVYDKPRRRDETGWRYQTVVVEATTEREAKTKAQQHYAEVFGGACAIVECKKMRQS